MCVYNTYHLYCLADFLLLFFWFFHLGDKAGPRNTPTVQAVMQPRTQARPDEAERALSLPGSWPEVRMRTRAELARAHRKESLDSADRGGLCLPHPGQSIYDLASFHMESVLKQQNTGRIPRWWHHGPPSEALLRAQTNVLVMEFRGPGVLVLSTAGREVL